MENRSSDFGISDTIKNDYNNTDLSETDIIHLSGEKTGKNQKAEPKPADRMDKIKAYAEIIKDNIDYDTLAAGSSVGDQEYVDEIVELLTELVSIERDTVCIAGAEYPFQMVKGKLNTEYGGDVLENHIVSAELIGVENRIRKCRNERHWSQEKLAEEVNVSLNTISRIEGGQTRMSIEVFMRLVQDLGVDAEFLLFGETSDSDKTDYACIRFLIGQLQRGEKEIVLQTMGTLAESLLRYR